MTQNRELSTGAKYEFRSALYPGDTLTFQAYALGDGAVGLSLVVEEDGESLSEITLTFPQLAEFATAMFAALTQAAEMEQQSFVRHWLDVLKAGIVENPFKPSEDGS